MRKIYALVLLAAVLLVGTNAWATDHEVSSKTELLTAWYSAASGDEIKLKANIENFDTCLWLGTKTLDETPRQLTLDLNGFTMNGTKKHIFFLTRGSLLIKTSVAGGTIRHSYESSTTSPKRGNGDAIVVCGSALNTVDAKTATSGYFTYLKIDEGVTLDANGACNALTINALEAMTNAKDDKETTGDMVNYYIHKAVKALASNAGSYKIAYHTNLWGTITDGLANGVRIEIAGTILAYQYGIKVNGNVRVPNWKDANGNVRTITDKYDDEFSGFSPDLNKTAFINLTSTGRIVVTSEPLTESAKVDVLDANGNKTGVKRPRQAQAVYASGYARWLLEGYCGGNVGVYAKSGDIEINDAVIESTSSVATNPTETGAGATAQGTAIIVQSTAAGSGEITVDITGDTEVSATSGYAIQESVTTPQNNEGGSYTSTVTVDGATINGGDAGAIAVTTKDNETYVVTVETGTIQGTVVEQGGEEQSEGTPTTTAITLDQLIENTQNTHTTTVYDENGQNPVVVVSPGAATPASEKDFATIAAAVAAGKTTVNLTGAGYAAGNVISSDLTLTELEMNLTNGSNQPQWQRVVINNNAVVKIGKVILGAKANIIVEAGSKLIITGEDGIYSRVDTNLVLRANATDQATFVIGPNVTSNRQPYATVELYTSCYKVNANSWKWQRFASPLIKTTTVTHDRGTNINTGVKYIDDATETWVAINQWADLRPFKACAITNDLTDADTKATYRFPGKLMGNVTDSIRRKNVTWNYYGNSYMAPMSTKALLNVLSAQSMGAVIYYWDFNNQGYNFVTSSMLGDWGEGLTEIPAMGFFVLKNNIAEAGALNIDYNNSIFRYAQGLEPIYPSPAPMRSLNGANRVRINIQAENGNTDVVYLLGHANYTDDFEDGADVEKLMNEGMNLYVEGDMTYSMLYTDNLVGTILTLQTAEDINYTMTFGKVNGELYALRDNMTNALILMSEGATYNFTAQPNATLEGRFQIVSRQEMPTAVETVEDTVNAPKAVYTVMGQYVGETSDWNSLPAGVYVVDGVKIVK